jgi:hypothetical protein
VVVPAERTELSARLPTVVVWDFRRIAAMRLSVQPANQDSITEGGPMGSHLRTDDLTQLYEALTLEERDELLQCLLLAAPRGGEAMVRVLEELILCLATEHLTGSSLAGDGTGSDCR